MRSAVAWGVMLVMAAAANAGPLARIRLYNPTDWDGPTPVEVPVGRLASPGLIRWDRVSLVLGEREVPFAIREGRPHWKAALRAPGRDPRAEDLLVFSCAVPPRAWVTVDVVSGEPHRRSALRRDADSLIVSYPGLRVTVDAASGLLAGVDALGMRVLQGPMKAQVYRLGAANGKQREPVGTPSAELVFASSTAAMTELSFVRDTGEGLATALTYRVHSCGLTEVWADERPWQGTSPWATHAVEYSLPMAGDPETLPYLVNRAPYYGFRDFAAVAKHPAAIRRIGHSAVIELGEEIVNGRRWCRRLYVVPRGRLARTSELVELADEGLVVDVEPHSLPWRTKAARIVAPPEGKVAAETLADALRRRGIDATTSGPPVSDDTIRFRLVAPGKAAGLSGDGFAVLPEGHGVGVSALTPFGLSQAARRIAEYVDSRAGTVSLPLIASNPAVDLRSGGFGGGEHEVDFPYGADAEWEHAFEGLISSGMNVMADLSMWGNWKMPVTYKYMPELRSDSPDAFDQASGARFSEIDRHREHGLKLLNYLHRRGVKVWQWVPVGCVPTTYARAHPEAMSPTNPAVPCLTDPLYRRYLEAYAKELLETYPIDGVVTIRDDNGGICGCDRCKAFVAASRTGSAMWEQHLLLYEWLRSHGFQGDIAVYPYNDPYEPGLDGLLPADLLIVGHGSGAGVLSRGFEVLGPMGDTWIDNVFASFRPAATPRMRRLLADRGSFWIGGAYCGAELPWESIGFFGWEPTATVNSFRYWRGSREFGRPNALTFVALADAYEDLWDIYDLPMLPQEWAALGVEARARASAAGWRRLQQFRDGLAALEQSVGDGGDATWFAHMHLFATYFQYHLRRLELFSEMQSLVLANRDAGALPEDARSRVLAMRDEVYRLASVLDEGAATVPGNMLAATRRAGLTQPFREWVAGYDALEWSLEVKQFAGHVSAALTEVAAGQPFTLRVELQNTGIWPWVAGVGQELRLGGDAERLGLPLRWDYDGDPMVYGDRRVVALRGTAPAEPGEGAVTLSFLAPFRNATPFANETARLAWR